MRNRIMAALASLAAIVVLSPAQGWTQEKPPPSEEPKANPPVHDNPHNFLPLSNDDTSAFAERLRTALAANEDFSLTVRGHPPERALTYSAEEKASAAKAIHAYIEAVQLADFSSATMLRQLITPPNHFDWEMLANINDEKGPFIRALVQALAKCPPHKAAFPFLDLFSRIQADLEWWNDLESMRSLASALEHRQPHLLRYSSWGDLRRGLRLCDTKEETAQLAQAIVLANLNDPGSPPPTGQGVTVLEYDPKFLEETLLDNAEAFVTRLDKVVQQYPEDRSRILFWLKAHATCGTLRREHLAMIKKGEPIERLIVAQDTISVAHSHQEAGVFDPWVQEVLARLLLHKQPFDDPGNPEYLLKQLARDFALLKSPDMTAFVRANLHEWIEGIPTESRGEDPYPGSHCEFMAALSHAFGSPSDELEVFNRWLGLVYSSIKASARETDLAGGEHKWVLSGYLEAIGSSASHASPEIRGRLGIRLAHLLTDLIKRGHLPDGELAACTLQLLLANSQTNAFADLCTELERAEKPLLSQIIDDDHPVHPHAILTALAVEMLALQKTLLPGSQHLPIALSWTRAGKTAQDPPQIAWEFAVPIVPPPDFPDDVQFWTRFSPSWRRGHGLRSPLLEQLSGAYDIVFEMGDSPEHFKEIAKVTKAGAHGSITLARAPSPCGYLRAVVRDPTSGKESTSRAWPYSLEPAVLSTGPEPLPDRCGDPYATAAPGTPSPVVHFSAIDPQHTFLLTSFAEIRSSEDGDVGWQEEDRTGIITFVTTTEPDLHHCIGRNQLIDSLFEESPSQRVNACRFSEWWVPAHDLSTDLLNGATTRHADGAAIRYLADIAEFDRRTTRFPLYQLRPFHSATTQDNSHR